MAVPAESRPSATVALVYGGNFGPSTSTAARIEGFETELVTLGWRTALVPVPVGVPHGLHWLQGWSGRLPRSLRAWLMRFGFEGDIDPWIATGARRVTTGIQADIVVVSVPPFSLLACVGRLSRRVPVVVDCRDPWSISARPSVVARLLRPVERRLLAPASGITYPGNMLLGAALSRIWTGPESRVRWVPDGVLSCHLDGANSSGDERRTGPLRLVSIGQFYARHRGQAISAALKHAEAKAELDVIGANAEDVLVEMAARSGGSVRGLPPVARQDLYRVLSTYELGVVDLGPGIPYETAYPSKCYDYAAAGLPVLAICPDGSAALSTPGLGTVHHYRPEDVGAIAAFLRLASDDRTLLGPRRGAVHERVVGVRVLDGLLRELLRLPPANEPITR